MTRIFISKTYAIALLKAFHGTVAGNKSQQYLELCKIILIFIAFLLMKSVIITHMYGGQFTNIVY